MTRETKVCAWDLEGPLSFTDFAAEICKMLPETGKVRVQGGRFDELFLMLSKYDDYLIDHPEVKGEVGIGEYEPGDTLRLLAPVYVHAFTSDELRKLSEGRVGLIPGAREFVGWLRRDWDVFVISTSYTQHAYTVTRHLGIPEDHVYCTDLPVDELKAELDEGEVHEKLEVLAGGIFPRYLAAGGEVNAVLDDLHDFFWGRDSLHSTFRAVMDTVRVRGGKRKEAAVEDISRRTGVPVSDIVATGDSITDIDMLGRASREGGIGISFNGNEYSLSTANLAATSTNLMGMRALFEAWPDAWEFVESWEAAGLNGLGDREASPSDVPRGLVSDELRSYLVENSFLPKFHDLRGVDPGKLADIVELQKETRRWVRGWVGALA
ncbi:MAG: hypothetical protein ACTSU5_01695 [Promethearchaeota archaeon]